MGFAEATLDHWKPKAIGGGNTRDNFRLTCAPCNNKKGGMTPWEWIMRDAL
jgi:5-methylcytosine-specific restriction endonuclease McrA